MMKNLLMAGVIGAGFIATNGTVTLDLAEVAARNLGRGHEDLGIRWLVNA